MLYSIVAQDIKNSLKNRLKARPEHIKRLQALQAEGRLIIAGPNPTIDSIEPGDAGFSGSLIIAEFSDLATAQQWAEQDPYVQSGAYASVEVKPFKQVLP